MSAREFVKLLMRGLATAIVSPEILSFQIRRAFMGKDRALEGSTQLLSLIPGMVGQYLRRAFLQCALEECHPTACIEFGTIFSQTQARIGPGAYVGPRCHLGRVHLGADVLLAAGVHVPSGAHTHATTDLTTPIREQPQQRSTVRIGRGAWIGSGAVILADVGEETIVGAGAVVTHPLPDRVIAAGVPARVLRARDSLTEKPVNHGADHGESATTDN